MSARECFDEPVQADAPLFIFLAQSLRALGQNREALEHADTAVTLTNEEGADVVSVHANRLLYSLVVNSDPGRAHRVLAGIVGRCQRLSPAAAEAAQCSTLESLEP